ncbi:MAG: response regulator transcription factor [Anaerolineaceae bacterium]|nr:response regulator transcription factor [Anaerolineaceae bacterium]
MTINESSIRLLICDDQSIVCEGLRAILSNVSEVNVIGTASNGKEAIDLIPGMNPDIILMDLKMPIMNGIQATKIIREKYPHIHVLVLTTFDSDDWVLDAIRSGASGYLLKDTPKESLVAAILDTIQGRSHIDPQVAPKVLSHVSHQPKLSQPDQKLLSMLSEREREILQLLARGFSNAEISQTLFLSDGTVKNYMSTIFSKLSVNDRTQAALFAMRAGLGE